jgi:hypothetical protein
LIERKGVAIFGLLQIVTVGSTEMP